MSPGSIPSGSCLPRPTSPLPSEFSGVRSVFGTRRGPEDSLFPPGSPWVPRVAVDPAHLRLTGLSLVPDPYRVSVQETRLLSEGGVGTEERSWTVESVGFGGKTGRDAVLESVDLSEWSTQVGRE